MNALHSSLQKTNRRLSPIWAALLIGALIAAIVSRGRRRFHSHRTMSPRDSRKLHSLRAAIIGMDKPVIAAALGTPRATIGCGNLFHDDTWYYPLDTVAKLVLAIDFEDGVAQQTHVIRAPVSAPSIYERV